MTLNSKFISWFINYLMICLMPELHSRCRTVCPNNRKLNSYLISPFNFLNWTNGSQIREFLSVTSEPSVGGPSDADNCWQVGVGESPKQTFLPAVWYQIQGVEAGWCWPNEHCCFSDPNYIGVNSELSKTLNKFGLNCAKLSLRWSWTYVALDYKIIQVASLLICNAC